MILKSAVNYPQSAKFHRWRTAAGNWHVVVVLRNISCIPAILQPCISIYVHYFENIHPLSTNMQLKVNVVPLWRWGLSSLRCHFTFTVPKESSYSFTTATHVAGWVGPDTAGKRVAAHAQSHHPQWVWPGDVHRGWVRPRTVTWIYTKNEDHSAEVTHVIANQFTNFRLMTIPWVTIPGCQIQRLASYHQM